VPEITQETEVHSFTIKVICYNYIDEKFMAQKSSAHTPRHEILTTVLINIQFMEFYAMFIELITDIF
jgi:hypothetical protein